MLARLNLTNKASRKGGSCPHYRLDLGDVGTGGEDDRSARNLQTMVPPMIVRIDAKGLDDVVIGMNLNPRNATEPVNGKKGDVPAMTLN